MKNTLYFIILCKWYVIDVHITKICNKLCTYISTHFPPPRELFDKHLLKFTGMPLANPP